MKVSDAERAIIRQIDSQARVMSREDYEHLLCLVLDHLETRLEAVHQEMREEE